MAMALAADVITHNLALMGWPPRCRSAPLILDRPTKNHVHAVRSAIADRRAVIALSPDASFSSAFAIGSRASNAPIPALFTVPDRRDASMLRAMLHRGSGIARRSPAPRLRTVHSWTRFEARAGEAVLRDAADEATWWWLPDREAGILFVGTDIAGDLLRYRQGDRTAVAGEADRARWGYAGERPNYLFEGQRRDEPPDARHADEWASFLAQALAERVGVTLQPILPGGAAGAVVLTGDDDQAPLDSYEEQLAILGDTPITYFLHPLTRHTPETLQAMLSRPGIDLGLHPDALDAPTEYDQRFREQASWFRSIVGRPPRSLRNHGFLNRGYWGHLDAWLAGGIAISTNLPGFDGTILNGSLLPARVSIDDRLTDHWSVLTAIGDGVLFAAQWSPERAAERVLECADRIRSRGMPGVLVLNLHPANIAKSRRMHQAAMEVCRSGFLPWTLRQCHDWFSSRDGLERTLERD